MGAWPVRVQARDARASAVAQRRKAMAVAPKKRPPVTISGRSRAGSGITMKVLLMHVTGQLSLLHMQFVSWPGAFDYRQCVRINSVTRHRLSHVPSWIDFAASWRRR